MPQHPPPPPATPADLIRCTTVTGLILAGGLGRRMGGMDKGLAQFQGQPLVAHVRARLAPQVAAVQVNANRNPEAYAALGLPVVADRLGGFPGPLAGLEAGLAAADEARPWVATCPCDAPFLPLDLVARLLAAAQAARVPLAVARLAGRLQPVFLLARRELAPSLAAYLARGERRAEAWVLGERHVAVDFDDQPAAFANLNTQAELAQAAAQPNPGNDVELSAQNGAQTSN